MPPTSSMPPLATDIDAAVASAGDWQPLPARSLPLFVLAALPMFALPAAAAGFFLARFGHWVSPWMGLAIGLLLGGSFAAWRGAKQHRYTRWRLDTEGLSLRRGRLWQQEIRVPATRVQHLDLTRGPLQRGRRLATLVVHTAGSRHGAVSVPNLDEADAEHLRETLSRQIDLDDDA